MTASASHGCVTGCPRTDTRPYAEGWFCPAHTPASRRGHPEPDSARYCLARCYCGTCPQYASQVLEPITTTVLDDRAVASGKRRSSPGVYREARTRTEERAAKQSRTTAA
jgi:hypothetical protein